MFKLLLGMFSNDIAIDLGTANTRVVRKNNDEIVANEKSVIATSYNRYNQEVIEAIGQDAIDKVKEKPENIKLFKPIQDGVISNMYAEMMVRYFLEKAHNRKGLFSPRVMVSVPYNITSIQRQAVNEVLLSAGAREIYQVENPMATAVGAGLPIKEPIGQLVVDIGAGTTDIAIMSLGGIVYGKSIKIAGDAIDKSIINYVKKKFNIIIHKREAERVKIEIGTAGTVIRELSTKVEYFDQTSSLVKSIKLTSADINEAIERPLQDIAEAIIEVLEYDVIEDEYKIKFENIGAIKKNIQSDKKNMLSDIKRNGIFISGGTSLLKGLDRYLSDKVKVHVKVSSNPLLDNITGLGLILKEIDLFESNLKLR